MWAKTNGRRYHIQLRNLFFLWSSSCTPVKGVAVRHQSALHISTIYTILHILGSVACRDINPMRLSDAAWVGYLGQHCRADSRLAHIKWDTALICNDVSHWLDASLESDLHWGQLMACHLFDTKSFPESMVIQYKLNHQNLISVNLDQNTRLYSWKNVWKCRPEYFILYPPSVIIYLVFIPRM